MVVDYVSRLSLKGKRWTTPISWLTGVPVVNVQGRVNLAVQPRFANEPLLDVNVWILPSITGDLLREALPRELLNRIRTSRSPTLHFTSRRRSIYYWAMTYTRQLWTVGR